MLAILPQKENNAPNIKLIIFIPTNILNNEKSNIANPDTNLNTISTANSVNIIHI